MDLLIKLLKRDNMNSKPLFDRVVIQVDPVEEKTSAGFYIPASSTEKANTGTVVAVGPGRANKDGAIIPMIVQVNDRVMFPVSAGIKVKIDGEDLLVVKEDELIAILGE